MAKVIYRLWKDQNADYMILPGSLPLYDGDSRNELVYYLTPGWDAVLEKDIDGERAETTALDTKETRFGQQQAARRVARTLFLGSAPSSGGTKEGNRGIDRARVLIGCLQPGQSSSLYSDALNRLTDRLHYLNSSGDKSQDATRFWFDTRANLRREMEDRKGRFDDKNEVLGKIATVLKKMTIGTGAFDGTHIFTPHADVPDDAALRLVLLPPSRHYTRDDTKAAFNSVEEFIRNNGDKPRYRGNRLIFVAPDWSTLTRVRDCVRTALAWGSIVDDVKEGRLNIDRLQEQQAKKELATAEDVLPRVARECYRWLLCPVMTTPTDQKPTIEAFQLNTSGSAFGPEVERVCTENELVITVWSPIHLRSKLKDLYWKDDKTCVGAMTFWDDSNRYLYLPRLSNRNVLGQAIIKGAGSKDFFGTAYGQSGEKYDGFKFGDDNVQLDDTLLLIEPEAAIKYEATLAKTDTTGDSSETGGGGTTKDDTTGEKKDEGGTGTTTGTATGTKAHAFYGSIEINPATAKMRLVQVAEEIISLLASDPQAALKITVEINAEFPEGASDQIKRAVSENATSLKFGTKTWD
jgi:hypothetical protein